MHLPQAYLDGLGHLRMSKRALERCRRIMITLDDLGAFAPLLLQLERRLEEVHVEACCRIEPRHDPCRLGAIEAAVADEPAHDGTVLLLDERLVVLLVGARPRHLDLLTTAPGHDDVVHEGAVVVEVGTPQEPGEQALRPLDRLDHEPAVTGNERQAFGPARRHVDHRQCLDEGARHRRATVRHHVDLAEAGRRVLPVVEGADRHLAPDR